MIGFGRTATLAVLCAASWAGAEEVLTFNRHIRPILSNNCFQCHGPDKNTRMGGLRLDVREEAVALRDGGAAIVPGASGDSLLIQRMRSHDPDLRMPPAESERIVTAEEIDRVARWIDDGAEYEPHWSYLPPRRYPEPRLEDGGWARNAVDRFVYRRLDMNGLQPSPEADRVTLLRRLAHDLTGLPPSAAEVDAFVNDEAPDAYERLVDRLLASPHYGERMAVHWLDLVRYADTNGYHSDQHRSIWPYRDYVIEAFNTNKPYDRFTVEQLAGDLLPEADRETRVASAYNRLNQLTAEGGAQPKEYLAKYAADRVRTAGSVWLGATLGCAECHDHKFDPITIDDFYAFSAFFADIEEQAVYSSRADWDPLLHLPSPEQEAKLAELDGRLAELDALLAAHTPELEAAQAEWEAGVRAAREAEGEWTFLAPESAESQNGAMLAIRDDGSVLASGPEPEHDVYTVLLRTDLSVVTGLLLDAPTHKAYGRGSAGNVNFVLSGIEIAAGPNAGDLAPVAISRAQADYEQEGFPVAAAFDGDPATGWAVDGHIAPGDHRALFAFATPIEAGPERVIAVTLRFESEHAAHAIGLFRVGFTGAGVPALPPLPGVDDDTLDLILAAPESRTPEQAETLGAHYRAIAPALAPVREEHGALTQARAEVMKDVPYTLVTRSVEPREIRVLPRGNFLDETGPVVQPAIPAVFGTLDTEGRATRLDLANWLVSKDNPEAARVYVNHLWKLYFGTGLSRVLDDLGSQGEWPSHPDLLDWLAVEFVESGWDVKHMVRLLVTTSAYRQSSDIADPRLKEADPFNRLLARQSRFRYSAEFIRDYALNVAGLLEPVIGGRSVFPYQPDGYWDNCNTFTGPLIYTADEGANQYRRGLYTYWKRSFLHPSLLAFDAPSREECTAQRPVSNTPLQALVLLNDPSYVEAARALAERSLRECAGDEAARIDWLFRAVLSRAPEDRERAVLLQLLGEHRARYEADSAAASEFLSVGIRPAPADTPPAELAAWTSVARVLLNLHETITRA